MKVELLAAWLDFVPDEEFFYGQTGFCDFSGDFHPMQLVDVIGQVADFFSPLILHHEVIQTVSLQLLGRANVIRMKKEPVFNPG